MMRLRSLHSGAIIYTIGLLIGISYFFTILICIRKANSNKPRDPSNRLYVQQALPFKRKAALNQMIHKFQTTLVPFLKPKDPFQPRSSRSLEKEEGGHQQNFIL